MRLLIGRWSGDASVLRGPGRFVDLSQTEEAQFKLDGLLLLIEGVGRTKEDGELALQALGLISFDDESGTFQILYVFVAIEIGSRRILHVNVTDHPRLVNIRPNSEVPEPARPKALRAQVFYHETSTCATPSLGHAFWPL